MLGGDGAFPPALREAAAAGRIAAVHPPMKHDGKRSVSLEDLLRLKRAERPPESYWADFDRQLRAKQLAALVEKIIREKAVNLTELTG